jgi:hypothetical protein
VSWQQKVVTPAVKREAVAQLRSQFGFSERRACRIAGADRKMVRYVAQRAPDTALRSRLRESDTTAIYLHVVVNGKRCLSMAQAISCED